MMCTTNDLHYHLYKAWEHIHPVDFLLVTVNIISLLIFKISLPSFIICNNLLFTVNIYFIFVKTAYENSSLWLILYNTLP